MKHKRVIHTYTVHKPELVTNFTFGKERIDTPYT